MKPDVTRILIGGAVSAVMALALGWAFKWSRPSAHRRPVRPGVLRPGSSHSRNPGGIEMSDEYGPPTLEDDAWYTHAVVSLDYPKVKRGDKPMEGQESLPWSDPIGDIQAAIRRAEEKYERDWNCPPRSALDMSSAEAERRMGLELEREDADEQRAREDEHDQFRTGRPE